MKKFDFCIGNPPYQDVTDSDSTRMPPVYNYFMDAANEIADKVELVHPARFLFNAGYTPKAWNEKMLADPHFKVLTYEPDASRVFPNTEIKGGIAITYRNSKENFGPIEIFTKYPELNKILSEIKKHGFESLSDIINSPLNFQVSEVMKKENPDLVDRFRTSAFTTLSKLFYDQLPEDKYSYIGVIGLEGGKRKTKYIRRDYLQEVGDTLDKYTLLVSKANGAGEFGETLSSAVICKPGTAYTQTFIGIGSFDTALEVNNVNQYIKTKFCRAMLGILKITQDCPGPKWKYVPLQDFTSESDINWNTTIANIDKQLYKKYNLTDEEIEFIETHVKEME